MRKIPSLFMRNYDTDRLVRDEVVPGAEWVLAGEGVATRKYDGTCCSVRDGQLFKRYELKRGRKPPPGFEPAQEPDPTTGDVPGWVPVGDGPEDRWHRDAWIYEISVRVGEYPADGTYELCGPRVQGDPEGCARHILIRHGADVLPDVPRDYDGIREYLSEQDIEGIVWYHPDGRMVKIKKRDFGFRR